MPNKRPNEIIFCGDICRIILYDTFGTPKVEAMIDAEDLPVCQSVGKWHLGDAAKKCHGEFARLSFEGGVAI